MVRTALRHRTGFTGADDRGFADMNVNLDEIGQVADTLDSLVAAMNGLTHLPAETHLGILKEAIPEASLRIKNAVIAETGEDPWGIT